MQMKIQERNVIISELRQQVTILQMKPTMNPAVNMGPSNNGGIDRSDIYSVVSSLVDRRIQEANHSSYIAANTTVTSQNVGV
jgi:hypothetical protein